MLAEENREGGGGHNWEQYFIGLFHVSEHLGHFRAIQNFTRTNGKQFCWGVPPPLFGKKTKLFPVCF